MNGEHVESRLRSIGTVEHTAIGHHLHEKLRDSEVVEASVLADGRLPVGEREGSRSGRRYDERLPVSRSLP